jgi:WD40 repeat protein
LGSIPKPFDVIHIEGFLGISRGLKVYARWMRSRGVEIVDLETGKNLVSPRWDWDWGTPFSVAFGNEVIAVVTHKMGVLSPPSAVRVFSRKTGELVQNIHGHDYDKVAFTADGRILAITEYRHLLLRDIQEKKTVAEFFLEGAVSWSLAMSEKHVAVSERDGGRISVLQAETGKLVKQLTREKKDSRESHVPLAVSPAGDLLAWGDNDAVVLCDIASAELVHKLEGHLDTVQAVAFSPNGEFVASTAKDKTIRFWSVKQGKEIYIIKDLPASPSNYPNNPAELIFSTDGHRIAVTYPVYSEGRRAEIRSVDLK